MKLRCLFLALALLPGCKRALPPAPEPAQMPVAETPGVYHTPELQQRMLDPQTAAAAAKLQKAGVISRGLSHCYSMAQAGFDTGGDPSFAYGAFTTVCQNEFAQAECYAHEKPKGEAAIKNCTKRHVASFKHLLDVATSRQELQAANRDYANAREEANRPAPAKPSLAQRFSSWFKQVTRPKQTASAAQ